MTINRSELERALFALGDHVRYVAFGVGQDIHTAQRGSLEGASDESSDFYEELLVNPTLLTIARQRGAVACAMSSWATATSRRSSCLRSMGT